MVAKRPSAPRGLGARGRGFWRAAWDVYEFSAVERELLVEACRTLDVVEALEGVVADEGPTAAGSKGQVVVHPAVGELRQQRMALGRLLAQLDLPDEDGGQVVESPATLRARKAAESRWWLQEQRTGRRRAAGGA